MSRLKITELVDVVRTIDAAGVVPVVAALTAGLVTIGLGYLTLSRATTRLSGGESQRIKTVKHLGSSLTEMT